MIENIRVIRNESLAGYPKWVDWIENEKKNSIEVESKEEKISIVLKLLDIRKSQSEKEVKTIIKREIRYIKAKR